MLFGTMGSGKTSLYRYIGREAINHYGKKKVNAIISTSLDELIDNIDSKPVQILFLDDAGMQTQTAAKTLIAKFTSIRHTFSQKRTTGVIIVLFAVQDYFLLAKKLRSTLHVEFFKHAPTNKHDISQIKGFLGYLAMKLLLKISKKVFEEHKYEWLSTCIAKTISGTVGTFEYDFIKSKDSVLKVLETDPDTPSVFAITDGDYQFLPLKEFENNELVIEALYNWQSIKKKINLSTKLLKQVHIDAFIKYMQGDRPETIAQSFNRTASAITNNYKGRGWLAIVRTEILGHLVEYQLTQAGQYYDGYKRIAGNARIDLLSKDKKKAIEVKVREQRETPTVRMFSKEMLELLEKDKPCELCSCVIRENKATFKIFKISKTTL